MTIKTLLLQCAAIAMIAAPVSWCGVIQFSPSSTQVRAGDSFTVDLSADGVFDLYAIQFDLSYDPAVIAANSVTEGAFLPLAGATVFDGGTIDNTSGTISLIFDTLSSATAGASGTGVLATFSFTALTAGESPLQLANVTALDSSLNDLKLTPAAGSVTVTPEPATWLVAACALAALGWRRRVSGAR